MSLSCKLLVYAYYGAYSLPHKRYGESYHLYRIVQEHLSDSYVGGASCVRRDIETARRLSNGALGFEVARQLLDLRDTDTLLSTWYWTGHVSSGVCGDVQCVLAEIEQHAPLEKRVTMYGKISGAVARPNIATLDLFTEIPLELTDKLQVVIGRFLHFARCNELARVAHVFDPTLRVAGWWYHKFCVLTYMHRITCGAVPELAPRLRAAVAKFIKPKDDEGNCALAMAEVYGRFCGIAREHFAHHKSLATYVLFQCMRNKITPSNERFQSFSVIKSFARHCKETYEDLQTQADTLYIYANTDRQKNAFFDLLCCVNASEIDADCYDYVVNNFYSHKI
uniref:Ac11 n=1 Tax=Antheraea pernyi nuclear polyhedrosis virus TaxID=161494 RepID=A8C6F0_NPVAP|nr:unknown [Antheraea pernyi nucleopolyhedrovirus]